MENDNEKDKLVENNLDDEQPAQAEEEKKIDTKIEKKEGDKEDPKKKEEPKLVFMKKGTYTVHILILEVKNIEKKDPEYLIC
jgi:hypothetical protein